MELSREDLNKYGEVVTYETMHVDRDSYIAQLFVRNGLTSSITFDKFDGTAVRWTRIGIID